jgi:hypothetical protein
MLATANTWYAGWIGTASNGPTASMVKLTHKGSLRDVLAWDIRKLRAARGLSQETLAIDAREFNSRGSQKTGASAFFE